MNRHLEGQLSERDTELQDKKDELKKTLVEKKKNEQESKQAKEKLRDQIRDAESYSLYHSYSYLYLEKVLRNHKH